MAGRTNPAPSRAATEQLAWSFQQGEASSAQSLPARNAAGAVQETGNARRRGARRVSLRHCQSSNVPEAISGTRKLSRGHRACSSISEPDGDNLSVPEDFPRLDGGRIVPCLLESDSKPLRRETVNRGVTEPSGW